MKDLIEKIEKFREENDFYYPLGSTLDVFLDEIIEEAKVYNESVKTNADYIRNMTDEELADMLHSIGSYVNDGEPLIDIWIGEKETTLDDSFGDILDWLKAEREDLK